MPTNRNPILPLHWTCILCGRDEISSNEASNGCVCATPTNRFTLSRDLILTPAQAVEALLIEIANRIEIVLDECEREYYYEAAFAIGDTQARLESSCSRRKAEAHLAFDMARDGLVWSLAQDYPTAAFDPADDFAFPA
jgi:hypothetical protein